MTGHQFADLLDAQGFDFFTGVPCSLAEGVIAALERQPRGRRTPYVPAVREDVALGLAAGAWLGGRVPAVIMQNSGLGTSANALVSLSLLYRLPALLLMTWRGFEGKDAPEHIVMGEITRPLLDLMGVPHRVLARGSEEADLAWARAEALRSSQPVALLLPPRVLEADTPEPAAPASVTPQAPVTTAPPSALPSSLSRFEALSVAVGALGSEPVVHANGYVCRESFAVRDRPENFYMIGSMGLASSIALGLALARPERRTVVFDGDGNLLMNLGILPMVGGGPAIGRGRPANFVHVVFDNSVYASTGGQLSPSRGVGLAAVAAACGYARAESVDSAAGVESALRGALEADGPSFILVRVNAEEHPAPRIPYAPEEIRDRFRRAIGSP
ncbi:MAG TPA: thiamine pyrophosphate-dependent enzyme [Methylomirabilota bacterium]|nr:thiamine pyrophosphate-dependent enzyme [Methylomirabilota bacterium]